MPPFAEPAVSTCESPILSGTRYGDLLAGIVQAQSDVAATALDSQAIMDVIVERTRELTGADAAVIELLDGEQMVYRAACGTAAEHLGLRLAVASSLSGRCVRTGAVLTCDDSETDPRVDRSACRKVGAKSMVVVPLLRDSRPHGVLKVLSARVGAFDPWHVSALRLIAGFLAASLAHASEYEGKQALLVEKSAALDALGRSHVALRESEERFRSSFDNAAIGMALVGPDGRWIKVNRSLCEIVGYTESELLATSFQVITHPEDLQADLEYVGQLLAGEVRTYQMTKRYFHKDGRVVWVLLSASLVRDQTGRPLYFISQIHDITDQRRSEWLEEARARVLEMIAADSPLQPVLTELISIVGAQLPETVPTFLVLDEGEMRHMPSALPKEVEDAVQARAVSFAAGLCAHAVGQEPPLTVSNLREDPVWKDVRDAALRHGLCGCWSVPIRSKDGTFLALLAVYHHRPGAPLARETRVLDTAAKLAVVAIEHFQMTRQLARLAQRDPLTGLANRMVFEDRLLHAIAQAKRGGTKLALLALDLDHFKAVNDTLGHQAGDSLLQQFAQRARGAVRESDTVARIGGDEFAVILPRITGIEDATQVARKLTDTFAEPFTVAGRQLQVTGSIGVALYPADGEDGSALQKSADAALYRVKQHGRSGFEVAGKND